MNGKTSKPKDTKPVESTRTEPTEEKKAEIALQAKEEKQLEHDMKEIDAALSIHSSRFFLVAISYIAAIFAGLQALTNVLYLIGPVIYGLVVISYFCFLTAPISLFAYRTYKPLSELNAWLDEKQREDEKRCKSL